MLKVIWFKELALGTKPNYYMIEDDDNERPPNLNFIIKPIKIDNWLIEVDSSMYVFYPFPYLYCSSCENRQIGEINIDGFVKTKTGIKVPVLGHIRYRPTDDKCHCSGDFYEGVEDHIQLSVTNSWHRYPDFYNDKVELQDTEYFCTISTTLQDDEARKLYQILFGKDESINYYSDDSDSYSDCNNDSDSDNNSGN